jgi:hypothetical protein
MNKFVSGFFAGIGLLILITFSAIGLVGEAYQGKIDEAKKAVDELYTITHSPHYKAALQGLELIQTTANTLNTPSHTLDTLTPYIQNLKTYLQVTAPAVSTLSGPLNDLSVLLQNPPAPLSLISPNIAANGRQLSYFLQAVVPLIPSANDLVNQIGNLPTAPSEAVGRISSMAFDAQSKLLEVRAKSEEAYNLVHSTTFQILGTAISFWLIPAILGGIIFSIFSLLGSGKIFGIIALVLTLCIIGASISVKPMIINNISKPQQTSRSNSVTQPLSQCSMTYSPTLLPATTPAFTTPTGSTPASSRPISAYTIPPRSSTANATATVGQLPLSDSVNLAQLDVVTINKLAENELNPPFNVYGFYGSKLIYLNAGQTIIITFKSNSPVKWDALVGPSFTGTKTNLVWASMGWVHVENPLTGGNISSSWTKAVNNNGTQNVTVVFSPDQPGYYMLNLINDNDVTQYCSYTIGYP